MSDLMPHVPGPEWIPVDTIPAGVLNAKHLGAYARIRPLGREAIEGVITRLEHFRPAKGRIRYLDSEGEERTLRADHAVTVQMEGGRYFTVPKLRKVNLRDDLGPIR